MIVQLTQSYSIKMFRFLFYLYHMSLIVVSFENVNTEEPCAPAKYIEQRLLEKMVEIDYKMQKILERLDNLERNEQQQNEGIQSFEKTAPQSLMVRNLETDGWQMIFRATAGNGQNVNNAWTTGVGTCADKPSTMERSYSCHYRNKLISNWSNLGIKYVKFAFFDGIEEVAYVIFNGKDSDMNSWFAKSRVISSSWPDLTSTDDYNYFSIAGYFDLPRLDRRFYINKLHNSCPGDLGHMAVINSRVASPVCLWDNHASYPQFIYSRINSVDFWDRRMFGTADFMAIFIKT